MSLLAIIGGLMLGGAVLGGATSSTISATQGINDACKKLDDANTKYILIFLLVYLFL